MSGPQWLQQKYLSDQELELESINVRLPVAALYRRTHIPRLEELSNDKSEGSNEEELESFE